MLNTVRYDPGQRSLFLAPVSSANTTEQRPLLAGYFKHISPFPLFSKWPMPAANLQPRQVTNGEFPSVGQASAEAEEVSIFVAVLVLSLMITITVCACAILCQISLLYLPNIGQRSSQNRLFNLLSSAFILSRQ